MLLNKTLAEHYKSVSQKIRIITEGWVGQEIFCPSCGTNIKGYENNRPAADFYCPICAEDFELKSKEGRFGHKIVNGAYQTLIERLKDNHNPNLFLLGYSSQNYEISDFFVIPKYFFVPEIIERRNPLSQNAHRAGWTGCNIILKNIPNAGRIFYIQNKHVIPKASVLKNWQRTTFLRTELMTNERNWTLDIMNCIDKLGGKEFSLSEIYYFEEELKQRHPRNKHIKDKIRQQLQILRDNGYLEFFNRGKYRLV
jgi:type II restriction enzyme